EVGYVGREVDSIIKDLADFAVKMVREEEMKKVRYRAEERAEERVLDILLPRPRSVGFANEPQGPVEDNSTTRQKFRQKLRDGELDDKEIEVDLPVMQMGVEIMAPPGMEEMTSQLQNLFQNMG